MKYMQGKYPVVSKKAIAKDIYDFEILCPEIAKIALERGTGARGLRTVIEEIMQDIMFENPAKKDKSNVKITKQQIEDFYKEQNKVV